MQRPAETPKKRTDDSHTLRTSRADAIEMLEAVATAEGLPIEWMLDHEKHCMGQK